MFNRILGQPEEIPVSQNRRGYKDATCCIISTIFAIALFVFAILAIVNYKQKNSLQTLQQTLSDLRKVPLSDWKGFLKALSLGTTIAFGLGLLWMVIVHLTPMSAPKIACILGFLSCLVIAVFCFILKNLPLRYYIAGVAIICAIILLVFYISYSSQLRFQGIFLKYATVYLNEWPRQFLWIIAFKIFTFFFILLINFQFVAFTLKDQEALKLLTVIQFFWGIVFLNDAFNFIVGGNTTNWYWTQTHPRSCFGFSNLMCHSWGSVVLGSFLRMIFKIPLLIIQLLVCHPTACCNKCGNCCSDTCCDCLYTLVRSDAYAFINIFGCSYMDGTRYCDNLARQYPHYQSSQSPMRNYRIAAMVFLTALGCILSYLILNYRVQNIIWWMLVQMVIWVSMTVYYFVAIHSSVAQALQVCFWVQNQVNGGYQYMLNCLPSARKDLFVLSQKTKRDGNC